MPGVNVKECHCQWRLYPGDDTLKKHLPPGVNVKDLPRPHCYYLPYEMGGNPMCPKDPRGFVWQHDEL